MKRILVLLLAVALLATLAVSPAQAASVWAELGDLCFFRSRRKIRQAFFPS